MATRNIVPRATGEGGIGTAAKHWGNGYFDNLSLAGEDVAGTLSNMDLALAESTGYGIVSGCEPSISGLTVTVAAGVVHLANGTRKELSASTVTLDAADTTNPRIDLVYITSAGAVAKVTGTAAASPSAPALPSGGISVAQVSVAANAITGTIADTRGMLARWYNTGVVNVKDFGAVGDGVTDDTVAITAAINNSDVLVFTKGTYLINSPIVCSKEITIIGQSATIIDGTGFAGATTETGKTLLKFTEKCKLFGLVIDGQSNGTSLNGLYVLEIRNSGSVIKDCTIKNTNKYVALAVLGSSTKNIYISNCSIENYGHSGIECSYGPHKVRIEKCRIINGQNTDNVDRYGIILSGGSRPMTTPVSEDIWCINNYLEDAVPWWEGIDAHGGKRLHIIGNTVKGFAHGISVLSEPSDNFYTDDVEIVGNIIIGSSVEPDATVTFLGMSLNGINNLDCSHNIIKNIGNVNQSVLSNAGLYLSNPDSYGANMVISDNIITDISGAVFIVNSFNGEIRNNSINRIKSGKCHINDNTNMRVILHYPFSTVNDNDVLVFHDNTLEDDIGYSNNNLLYYAQLEYNKTLMMYGNNINVFFKRINDTTPQQVKIPFKLHPLNEAKAIFSNQATISSSKYSTIRCKTSDSGQFPCITDSGSAYAIRFIMSNSSGRGQFDYVSTTGTNIYWYEIMMY